MGYLLVAIFVIYIVVLILQLIASIALPLIGITLYLAMVFLLGRLFHRQLTKTYRLTKYGAIASALTLFITFMLAAWWSASTPHVIVPFAVLFNPVRLPSGQLLIPVWIWLFLALSTVIFAAWGLYKRVPYLLPLYKNKRAQQRLSWEQGRSKMKLKVCERSLDRLSQTYQTILQQKQSIENLSDQLVATKPQTFGVKRELFKSQFRRCSDARLRQLEEQRQSTCLAGDPDQQALHTLELGMARLERLNRRFGQPFETRDQLARQLSRLRTEHQQLTIKRSKLQQQADTLGNVYRRFCAGRIPL